MVWTWFYYTTKKEKLATLGLFEFPHFAIHRAKRFPSQSDGNTLHIKALWKAGFSERFLCKMSMLPKAARPFGSIVSAIIKNGETQMGVAPVPKIFRQNGRWESLYPASVYLTNAYINLQAFSIVTYLFNSM